VPRRIQRGDEIGAARLAERHVEPEEAILRAEAGNPLSRERRAEDLCHRLAA
jgi:hypothetical protein